MKKSLIAIAMVLALSTTTEVTAQKHRHTPRTEQVDSTENKDGIEAFSDTTYVAGNDSTAYTTTTTSSQNVRIYSDDDVKGVIEQVLGDVDGDMIVAGIIALGVLFILFVLFPIILIICVVYFINRRRKERLKLAQMAMQNGQPIPEQLLKEEAVENSDDYRKGVRQMFTGIGLAIFLGFAAGEIGFGIGALVFCIGLGKWFIARNADNNRGNDIPRDVNVSDSNSTNNSNFQNYD